MKDSKKSVFATFLVSFYKNLYYKSLLNSIKLTLQCLNSIIFSEIPTISLSYFAFNVCG